MFSVETGAVLGGVQTTSVSGRGFTPEELAEQALNKIISVGSNCHPVIRDQAEAFREQIRGVLVHYMRQAVRSNHTTLANEFRAMGHPELVKLLGG
jgi:hypothetical protein